MQPALIMTHAESSVLFFKQVQNKMHWAAHRHTTAEVIYERVDVAKNYLTETIVMPAKYLESTSFIEYTLLP